MECLRRSYGETLEIRRSELSINGRNGERLTAVCPRRTRSIHQTHIEEGIMSEEDGSGWYCQKVRLEGQEVFRCMKWERFKEIGWFSNITVSLEEAFPSNHHFKPPCGMSHK